MRPCVFVTRLGCFPSRSITHSSALSGSTNEYMIRPFGSQSMPQPAYDAPAENVICRALCGFVTSTIQRFESDSLRLETSAVPSSVTVAPS